MYINGLEFLTIVVACKMWGDKWAGKRIVVQCDNEASVWVINTRKTRDDFMQSSMRELAFITARQEFEVKAVHVPGVSNTISDILSRSEIEDDAASKYHALVGKEPVNQSFVYNGLFDFSHPW